MADPRFVPSPDPTDHADYGPLLIALTALEYLWLSSVALGIPGNILALVVTLRKDNRALSPCAYIGALAVADNLVLFNFPIIYAIQYWGLAVESSVARVVMLISWYVIQVAGTLSSLFLALMSVERMIAVRFPLLAITYCTGQRAKKVIIVTTCIVGTICLIVFYVYRFKRTLGDDVLLEAHVPEAPVVETLTTVILLGIGTVIPLIVIGFSNVVIIYTIRTARKLRGSLTTSVKGFTEHRNLTRMLVIVSIAYFFTAIPFRLYEIFQTTPYFEAMYDASDPYWNMRFGIESLSVSFLSSLNYEINFYLYILCGGAKYRKDVLNILCCVINKK